MVKPVTARMKARITRPPLLCDSAARLAWRIKTRVSLVALRRRLSPGLPLSHTSEEVSDPAVLFFEALTRIDEAPFLLMGDDSSNEP
jgi:hypothetical protein